MGQEEQEGAHDSSKSEQVIVFDHARAPSYLVCLYWSNPLLWTVWRWWCIKSLSSSAIETYSSFSSFNDSSVQFDTISSRPISCTFEPSAAKNDFPVNRGARWELVFLHIRRCRHVKTDSEGLGAVWTCCLRRGSRLTFGGKHHVIEGLRALNSYRWKYVEFLSLYCDCIVFMYCPWERRYSLKIWERAEGY